MTESLAKERKYEKKIKFGSLLCWRRFKRSVPWATYGLTDSIGTEAGVETRLSVLLSWALA